MTSKPAPVLLGLATLLVGGIVGGMIGGAWLGRPGSSPGGQAATPGGATSAADPALLAAIRDLTDEIRRARNVPPPPETGERTPVVEEGSEPLAPDRIVAALDRLTEALRTAQGRVSPGGIGITPMVLPPPGSRQGALQELVGRDWEDISREYRFWTFQQVLDRFGRPDKIENERWVYLVPGPDGEAVFTFQFSQGYLMNVYD